MRVAIVDYTAGNIGSLVNAFRRLGAEVVVTRSREDAAAADAIVLPGVGSFDVATGVVSRLADLILAKPTLGICLGMQVLFTSSEEGVTRGLGLFEGRVVRVRARKVPHIGWSLTKRVSDCPILPFDEAYLYYMHSYAVPADDRAAAVVQLDEPYIAAICRDNVFATQFHPEKSGGVGMEVLRRFLGVAAGVYP